MTSKSGEEIKTLYPITNNSENLFRSIFSKNSLSNEHKINYLEKNYRTKCDFCSNLCSNDLYSLKETTEIKDTLVICGNCYETENFPKDLSKEMFEISNINKLFCKIEGKFYIILFIKKY